MKTESCELAVELNSLQHDFCVWKTRKMVLGKLSFPMAYILPPNKLDLICKRAEQSLSFPSKIILQFSFMKLLEIKEKVIVKRELRHGFPWKMRGNLLLGG